jgi:hypothetical protein
MASMASALLRCAAGATGAGREALAAHADEFLTTGFDKRLGVLALEIFQHTADRVANRRDGGLGVTVGTAQRFFDDTVGHTQFDQVLSGQAQGLGRFAHLFGILPQDRGAAFGRNHRVDRVFEHRDTVGGGEGHGAAGATFANHDRDQRHADLEAFLGRAGDGFGLAAFFGPFAGVCTGSVDKGDDRQAELVGHLHQANRLAIAFGAGHAEVAFDTALGVVALFVADYHDGLVVETGEATHDRVVIGEVAVACQRCVFGEQRVDVIFAVRTFRMTRDLAFAPGGQLFVEILEQFLGLAVQGLGLVRDVHFLVLTRHCTQFFGFAFNFGQRFFEVEVVGHKGLRGMSASRYMTLSKTNCN